MNKYFVLLLVFVLFVTGCNIHVIKFDSVNSIIKTVLYKDTNLTNVNYEGYSFYLPQGSKIVDKTDYNLTIKNNENYYYLYVDTVAYHYHTKNEFDIDENHFYAEKLSNRDLFGYVDIEELENHYFIVIMYNYAKIESYVLKEDFEISFANMCDLLSSIKYNDLIIDTYVQSNKFIGQEEKFDIFSSKNENDNFLKYEQEYGIYDSESNVKEDEDVLELQKD